MNEYFKIWQNTKEVNDDQLLNYLKGELKPADEHAFENQLINSSFESDAVDGLRELPAAQIQQSVAQLNAQLQKILPVKNKYERKQAFNIQQWIILAIVIVLTIALLSYGFLYMLNH